ncbi:hypothetical protein ABFX02_05G048900 [Erythranthe guttata]
MDRISELPKEILQRIIYFLSQKDAVRTSVLSKSWRCVWCTRPNLDFAHDSFKGEKTEFLSVVDKTLQHYRNQRLCLEEFRLCISLPGNDSDQESVSFLDKWIPLLPCMGVKDFQLSIPAEQSVRGIIDLPVVLKAESLTLLWLYNCNLGQNIPDNIPFVRLQELRLRNVLIKNEIVDKIISSCPLLTTMLFLDCEGLKTIKLDKKLHKYLKHFVFCNFKTDGREKCSVEIDAPTLETIETIRIIGSKVQFHGHKFSNLKDLILQRVVFFNNSIEQSQLRIDAPNINSFRYSGFIIPSISSTPWENGCHIFAPASTTSTLGLYIRDVNDAQSWFLRLSKLLQALRWSNLFLEIAQSSTNNVHVEEDILVQDVINGGNRPVVVEHLTLHISHVPSFLSVLNGLFCICRPRIITPNWFMQENWDKEREVKELCEFFRKIQMMRESGNRKIWQHLKDLTIQGFDESRQEWQTLQVTQLSESALLPDFDRFQVRLQWNDCMVVAYI